VVRGECRSMRLRVAAAAVWLALVACCLWRWGLSLEALVNVLGCAVVVAVTVTDLERRIVPNRIVVPALVVALVVQTARDPSVEWILSALGAGGFFLVLALVNPAGLGMGDVKLAAFLGAWLGAPVIVALFAGSLLAVIPAIFILVTQGRSARKVGIPFTPLVGAMSCGQAEKTRIRSSSARRTTKSPGADTGGAMTCLPSGCTWEFSQRFSGHGVVTRPRPAARMAAARLSVQFRW